MLTQALSEDVVGALPEVPVVFGDNGKRDQPEAAEPAEVNELGRIF